MAAAQAAWASPKSCGPGQPRSCWALGLLTGRLQGLAVGIGEAAGSQQRSCHSCALAIPTSIAKQRDDSAELNVVLLIAGRASERGQEQHGSNFPPVAGLGLCTALLACPLLSQCPTCLSATPRTPQSRPCRQPTRPKACCRLQAPSCHCCRCPRLARGTTLSAAAAAAP